MKKCTKCKVEKELTKFYKDKKSKDGLSYYCKSCIKCGMKTWRDKNPNYMKSYRKDNHQTLKTYNTQYRQDNKKYYQSYNQKYWENNKEKLLENKREWSKKNYHIIKWRDILHRTLKYLNTDKDTFTQELLGYSALELKEHLDKQGMDWSNDHIDHIIPISLFKENTPPHIVNDLRNLQPLPAKENLKKSNTFVLPADDSYIQEIKDYLKIKL